MRPLSRTILPCISGRDSNSLRPLSGSIAKIAVERASVVVESFAMMETL